MSQPPVKKILHISTHLGRGVGSVVLNYFKKVSTNKNFSHKLICLGYLDDRALESLQESKIPYREKMSSDHAAVLEEMKDSDIVLIHWWNHPLLSDFLIREKLPPSRVVIWSHIVGSPAPNNFTDKILRYPDLFVFTTPISYGTEEVARLPDGYKERLSHIWSTGTADTIKEVHLKKHEGFIVGYIGTVDFAKMHPDFLEMSDKAKIPGVKFVVVGSPNEKQIEDEAKRRNIGNKFLFTGFIPEDKKWDYLSSFDVFGYPLVPNHYGTCDQALQEAMMLGVVPVVWSNPMESYMVKDGVTGIVVRSKEEYAAALENIYHDSGLREILSKNARAYALENFSLEKMEKEWEKTFERALKIPKAEREWNIGKIKGDIAAADVFLESLGSHAEPFLSFYNSKDEKEREMYARQIKELAKHSIWQSETKSTVHNFNFFLPGDKYLSAWSKLMKEEADLGK